MRQPPDPGEVRHLLVRANNWIGDVVLASPALHALRERFYGARLTVLAQPAAVAALDGSPDIDSIIVFDHRGEHRGLAGRLRLISRLRAERFDFAVLFQKAFEAALLARVAGVPRILGYATDWRSWLLTDPIPETSETRSDHHARVFFELARAAGAPVLDTALKFPLSDEDRRGADRALRSCGIEPGTPLVTVHPGASKLPRAWHAERFGALAREACRLVAGRAAVLGSSTESALTASVASAGGPDVVDLTGRTSVREMAAAIERSRVFLGSDSGPMHIAAAVGAPILAVFGPGAPRKTAPFTDAASFEVLTKRFPCSPCRQHFFEECEAAPSGKPWCIEEVSLPMAIEALERLIARTGRSLPDSAAGSRTAARRGEEPPSEPVPAH